MGTEILSIFILIPLVVTLIDLIKIVRNENRMKHVILLAMTISLIGYFSLQSYFAGFNPMQGVVIGSLLYVPCFLILYCAITAYSRKTSNKNSVT